MIFIYKLIYFAKDFRYYLLINVLLICTFLFSVNITRKRSMMIRKMVTSLFFSLLAVVFIFSLFELYFRYFDDESDGLNFLQVNKKWQSRHVIYNSDFFRDRPFELDKKRDETRICAIGDSFTFGSGIRNYEDRFSNLLEKELKNSGNNVTVYNFGVPGVDTEEEIETYQNTKKFNCDIIVWQYYLNDIQTKDKSASARIFEEFGKRNKVVDQLSHISYFFDFTYWRFSHRYGSTYKNLTDFYLKSYSDEKTF